MIIRNFYTLGSAILPEEADAPLIVDPNAVLAEPIPFQCLQTISRRYGQITQFSRSMNLSELPEGYPLNVRGKPTRELAME